MSNEEKAGPIKSLEEGKFYEHQLGGAIAVLVKAKTISKGEQMICETNHGVIDSRNSGDISQFHEITSDEFMALVKKSNTVNR